MIGGHLGFTGRGGECFAGGELGCERSLFALAERCCEAGDHVVSICSGDDRIVPLIVSTLECDRIQRQHGGQATRFVNVTNGDISLWARLRGVGGHSDAPVGGWGGGACCGDHRDLIGHHLYPVAPYEPASCYYGL